MRVMYEFDSFGEVTVKGYKWFEENKTPKAIIVISHGMAEDIERYNNFADFLLSKDIFVYGNAHRGHGKTAKSLDELGYLGEDGWNRMREDLKYSIELARKEYPNTKILLLGHSMGSFLARDLVMDHSDLIDGLMLSGTGFYSRFKLRFGAGLSNIKLTQKGPKYKSRLLDTMVFGSNNKRIQSPKTKYDWISRDENVVKEYINNPYCGNIHTSSFFLEFFTHVERVIYQRTFFVKNENLKIYIFSGENDPVGDYGKGVKKLIKYYESKSFDVEWKFYPGGRHEMLNEVNKEEVYDNLLNWIERKIYVNN